MILVLITTVSILVLTGLAWIAGRYLRFPVCPICVGVAGTWIGMLGARFVGIAINDVMLGILLGGSVVGIAYQLEKRLPQGRSQLLWKSLFFPVGFAAAYGIVAANWALAATAAAVLLALSAMLFLPHRLSETNDVTVGKLEEQMKKCC